MARSHPALGKGAGCRTAQPCPAGAATGTVSRERRESETDSPAPREGQLGRRGFPPGMSGFPKPAPLDSRTHHGCCVLATCKQEYPLFWGGPREPELIAMLGSES